MLQFQKISIKFALSKFHILDFALKGAKNPLKEFEKNSKKILILKSIIKEIQKVKKIKNIPHSKAVKKLGMACSYPGTFNSSIHSILNSKNYKSAVIKTIKAGGCNCSRVNFIGAYFAAIIILNLFLIHGLKKLRELI